MRKPLVSFIVVSYNHAHFIIECLDSILAQTEKNWELIVADDASRDNSVEVFNHWAEKNQVAIKRVFNEQNRGLCATLNDCLLLVEGEFVKMIAADDFLRSDFLSKSLQRFEELGNGCGLISSNIQFVDNNSNLGAVKFPKGVGVEGFVFEQLLAGNFVSAPTFLIRKTVYDAVGNYDTSIIIEDWEFVLRMSQQFSIGYVDEPLAFYRQHENNISKSPRMKEGEWQILMKFENNGKYKHCVDAFVRAALYNRDDNDFILQKYLSYPHANALTKLLIRSSMPTTLYRLVNKIRSKIS